MNATEYLQSYIGGPRCSETYLQRHHPEIHQEISTLFPDNLDLTFSQKRTLLRLGIRELPKCKICGKNLTPKTSWLDRSTKDAPHYCSEKCRNKGPEFLSAIRKSMAAEANPFYGKKHSKETRDIISQKRRGKPCLKRRGIFHSEETKQKISEKVKLRFQSDPEKYKESSRLGHKRRLLLGFPSLGHAYNIRSIPYFQEIDKWLNSSGIYGSKEKSIILLDRCYYVDYYNEELQLIIYLGQDWAYIEINEKEYLNKSDGEKQRYIQEVIGRREQA